MEAQNNYIIGVDLGGTNVRAGLVCNGKVINHAARPIPQTENDAQMVIDCIIDTINQIFVPEVIGIGMGVPGFFDKEQGVIHSLVNIPSFRSIPICNMLYKEYHVPIEISNDVNCFALGEKFYGVGQNYSNLVGLSIGTGMGVGIINKSTLLEDANGGSGEYGEIPYLDANFETYCSGQFFKKLYNRSGEEMVKLAEAGDKTAITAFNELGRHLGKAIHVILLTLDPEAIIIGGSVSNSKAFFHNSMMGEIQNFIFKKSLSKIKIIYAENKFSPILGAAHLINLKNL